MGQAVVRFIRLRRPKLISVLLVIRSSLRAASATDSLMVEQGCAPLDNANFWFTMVKTRPLVGSIASTVPFMLPRASIAAWRTIDPRRRWHRLQNCRP